MRAIDISVTAAHRPQLIERLEKVVALLVQGIDTDEQRFERGGLSFHVSGEDDPDPPGAHGVSVAVEARISTDDGAYHLVLDVQEWFAQASLEDVVALAACQWGGELGADEVARFFEHRDRRVHGMFVYLDTATLAEDYSGFECHVERAPALRWLFANRPNYLIELQRLGLVTPAELREIVP